jgi:hypothetical protein
MFPIYRNLGTVPTAQYQVRDLVGIIKNDSPIYRDLGIVPIVQSDQVFGRDS